MQYVGEVQTSSQCNDLKVDKEESGCEIEYKFINNRHSSYQRNSDRFNSSDTVSTDTQLSANSIFYSSHNIKARKRRERLLSLQTSYEDDPDDTVTGCESNRRVTEVTKLGNGKIKKTVYLYNLETPEEFV